MRKLLSIFIIGIMVFGTGAVAFATGDDQTPMNQKNRPVIEKIKQVRSENMVKEQDREHMTTPAGISAGDLAALKALQTKIKANHIILEALRHDIRDSREEIKGILKDLKDDKKTLTEAQITELKAALKELKVVKQERKDIHDGTIMEQSKCLKDAHHNKDFSGAKTAMQKIIDEQLLRIDALKAIEVKLNNIIADLK